MGAKIYVPLLDYETWAELLQLEENVSIKTQHRKMNFKFSYANIIWKSLQLHQSYNWNDV